MIVDADVEIGEGLFEGAVLFEGEVDAIRYQAQSAAVVYLLGFQHSDV